MHVYLQAYVFMFEKVPLPSRHRPLVSLLIALCPAAVDVIVVTEGTNGEYRGVEYNTLCMCFA